MARTRGAKNKAKKPMMSFNERVRKVIKGEAETKEKVVNIFNQSLINGTGLDQSAPQPTGLLQNNLLQTLAIAQGPNEEEREGNKVENCKLRVRGVIKARPWNAGVNPNNYPFEVHMVAYKLKSSLFNDTNDLKVLPNNQTGIVDGTLINSVYPYNKDKYIFRKLRVFRLRPLYNDTLTSDVLNGQQSNAPMFHRFSETLDIHKDLKFNDNSTTPSNDWCGIAFFVINGDGSTHFGNISRADVTMDAILRYKDLQFRHFFFNIIVFLY